MIFWVVVIFALLGLTMLSGALGYWLDRLE